MFKNISLLFLLLALITTSAHAAEVFITQREKFYHLASCPKIEGKKRSALDEKQAESRNIRPCPVCLKTKKDK